MWPQTACIAATGGCPRCFHQVFGGVARRMLQPIIVDATIEKVEMILLHTEFFAI
jgi:hypothetical protein